MTQRNWNHEASVAAKWWVDQVGDKREDGMAWIFGLLIDELCNQENNPEIESPHVRIALRIDAPHTPVRKMTMHISEDSVKVYTGFASDGPQTELISKNDEGVWNYVTHGNPNTYISEQEIIDYHRKIRSEAEQ